MKLQEGKCKEESSWAISHSFSLFPTFAPFMTKEKKTNLRPLLKWVLWVLVVQLVLVNISASVYAYKFTHFY